MSTIVVGLDLSLTSAGVGVMNLHHKDFYTTAIKPPSAIATKGGIKRMNWLLTEVFHHARGASVLRVVEGPSYGNQGTGRQSGHHERAGLWWLFMYEADRIGAPVAIVPPAALKKYATGKGNAGKDEMLLATARRFEKFDGGNDEADALWLAAMGADWSGVPLVDMPAVNRKALEAVKWPEVSA